MVSGDGVRLRIKVRVDSSVADVKRNIDCSAGAIPKKDAASLLTGITVILVWTISKSLVKLLVAQQNRTPAEAMSPTAA